MKRGSFVGLVVFLVLPVVPCLPAAAQTINATLDGRVFDASGAAVPGATVTAANVSTGFSRFAVTSENGNYHIPGLPVGEYTASAELTGFQTQTKRVILQVGESATIDFTLAVAALAEQVTVTAQAELEEPTRTSVSSVINQEQIRGLPVNGRQFIDFALLAPGVNIGDTTSGSTDVIIEPVTKISFAAQNIHYNFVAIDGADDMSTASGIQKATPSQEAVQEFRVINTQYSVEAGRAAAGIVNIITKSGTNDFHGSGYEFFRNDNLDAHSILAAPGLNKLRQNQFGGTVGGPFKKDKVLFFSNYEGQRRRENPFYNSVILDNIKAINIARTTLFGSRPAGAPGTLPPEDLNQTSTGDYDKFLIKVTHTLSARQYLSLRYFINDERLRKISPLNDGFDLPSTFRDNFFRDHSLVGNLTSTFSSSWLNDFRVQFARRRFDFPTVGAQPHLEVANTLTMGVNRGNPDFYREPRLEVVDSVTWAKGAHAIEFGGNFNWVRTTESFTLFFPFDVTFASVPDFLAGRPAIFFYEKFQAPLFNEATLDPAIFLAARRPAEFTNQAKGILTHTYNGFFVQDKWRPTGDLTLNFGVRYEFETWPKKALDNDYDNIDPRGGVAYRVGTSKNIVVRGGGGLFHGIIPSALLHCQRPSCGNTRGKLTGRESVEDDLDAATRLLGFVPFDFLDPNASRNTLLNFFNGKFPVPFGAGTPGIEADFTVVRFARKHQAPYGIHTSAGIEFEPFKGTSLSATYLRVRGKSLGSFFNANQPPPSGRIPAHDSRGGTGLKDIFFVGGVPGGPPGSIDPSFLLYFEADSLWSSVYNGLLLNFTKRAGPHLGFGVSYTYSRAYDNGPNPSFVLVPQNSRRLDQEWARSADEIRHRFVANAVLSGPKDVHPIVNDFELGLIVTLHSAPLFTKFAGFDANGDGFPTNDRVGVEPRNTFVGDDFKSVDLRISRSFSLQHGVKLQIIGEAFNLLNTLNIRFFNTVYGAPDFIPAGTPGTFREGSPNPFFGAPRAIFNPRQVQLAARLSF